MSQDLTKFTLSFFFVDRFPWRTARQLSNFQGYRLVWTPIEGYFAAKLSTIAAKDLLRYADVAEYFDGVAIR